MYRKRRPSRWKSADAISQEEVVNDMQDLWPRLVIASLATWRLTHLLAREDGPLLLIARLRRMAGASLLGQMFDCFNCMSLWVAAPVAIWTGVDVFQIIMIWLALSGAACLCERLGQPDVVIRQLPDAEVSHENEQGDQHELLRTTS
jgi:hypothetical protein